MKRKSYIRTEQHRQLMSQIKKQQVITDEWRRKISQNHADVTGDKNPNWKGGGIKKECLFCHIISYIRPSRVKNGKGKFCSRKCYAQWVSKNLRGTQAYNWKGGRTSLIEQIRKLPEYKMWRENIFKRDNYRCVTCHLDGGWNKELSKQIVLNANHLEPFSVVIRKNKIKTVNDAFNCKRLWDLGNGQTLCLKCHQATDSYLNCKIIKEYRNV